MGDQEHKVGSKLQKSKNTSASTMGSLSNYEDDHNDDVRFNDQNNSSAHASCFLVHFFDVHSLTTT